MVSRGRLLFEMLGIKVQTIKWENKKPIKIIVNDQQDLLHAKKIKKKQIINNKNINIGSGE